MAPRAAIPGKTKKPKTATNRKGASARPKNDNNAQECVVDRGITPKQQRFVDEYLVDLNATQAAIRAGYSIKTAGLIGSENLKKPYIQRAIEEGRAKQQQRTEITADRVLREAWNQVTADASELTQLRIGACRYCHGIGHQFQFTKAEFEQRYQEWEANIDPEKGEFNPKGGDGFDPTRDPHPECVDCAGEGTPRVVLMDTRNLSPQAKSLFAGVKQTKFGIEIQMHSKDAAMEKLFKHLGLYENDNKQKSDPLTTLLHEIAKGASNGFTLTARDPEHDDE